MDPSGPASQALAHFTPDIGSLPQGQAISHDPSTGSPSSLAALGPGSPQPCGDLGTGDRVHILPGRDQVVVGPPRMLTLLLHEFGDVVDAQQPFPGIVGQDIPTEAELD